MGLRRLCKAANSQERGECPAIYVDDDPSMMVCQGAILEVATIELQEVAADETAVAIPTETLLRAAGLFLAECGRPQVLAEVQAYLTQEGR